MQITPWLAFVFGVTGSLALELVLLLQVMGPKGGVPGKYRTWIFWIARLSLAILSGVIAWAYYSPQIQGILYIHVGAATPAVLTRGSRYMFDEQPSEAVED